MIQASEKLKTNIKPNQREPYVFTDVTADVFDAFNNLFSEYYNNTLDSTIDIKCLVEKIPITYPKLIKEIMIFVKNYEFNEIFYHYKTLMHNIVNGDNKNISLVKIIQEASTGLN